MGAVRKIGTLVFAMLFINACKPKIALPEGAPEALRTKALLEKVEEAEFEFDQLLLKGNGRFEGQGMNMGFRFEIRVKKDSLIWVDLADPLLGLKLVRGQISADQYRYINRLERNYREGAPKEAAQSIGLDFEMPAVMKVLAANYWPMNPAEQKGAVGQYLMDGFLQDAENKGRRAKQYLSPELYRPQKVQVNEPETNRSLTVIYTDYEQVEGQWFPHRLEIDFEDGGEKTRVELEVKSVELNKSLSFPFRIPSGYKRLP